MVSLIRVKTLTFNAVTENMTDALVVSSYYDDDCKDCVPTLTPLANTILNICERSCSCGADDGYGICGYRDHADRCVIIRSKETRFDLLVELLAKYGIKLELDEGPCPF